MNVRRYSWLLGAACLLLAAAAMYSLSMPVVSVTQQTCDAILPGMSLAEASTIIGGPPRWYDGIRSFGGGVPVDHRPTWVTSSGQLVLEVDENGVVTVATFAPVRILHQDVAQMRTERLTRGMGESAIFAALGVLLVVIAVVLWRKRLLVLSAGSLAKEGNAAGPGLWIGVGNWGIGLCTWCKRAPAGS